MQLIIFLKRKVKELKLRKERRERGKEKRKVRERIREKVREGRRAGETDCAETPVAFSSPTAKTSSPRQPGAEELKSQASATFPPVNVPSPLPGSCLPLALASCKALIPLISENQQGPQLGPD